MRAIPLEEARETIFISVAAYRDPELGPTIDDCLAKARYPDRLRFVVCWQHDVGDAPPACFQDERVTVVQVGWRQSRGACWARAEIMKCWDDEDWYLQIDSHHRFVEGWDVLLLEQAALSGSPKPVVTAYGVPYSPGAPAATMGRAPLRMEFDRFSEDGIPIFRPGYFADWKDRVAPLRGRYASAHLFFAPGSFVRDVPYDPNLYFIGEEITLAVRAFTHGYDLFEPSRLIAWHEYSRQYRPKHWDDHITENQVDMPWHTRDALSRARVRGLLESPWVGEFGCGASRTIADYEAYSGISFRSWRVQDYTRRNLEPPNPPADDDWAQRTVVRQLRILLDPADLPGPALQSPLFWYVGFHNSDGQELFRQDVSGTELQQLLGNGQTPIALSRRFESTAEPATWTVMPYVAATGWLAPITRPVMSR